MSTVPTAPRSPLALTDLVRARLEARQAGWDAALRVRKVYETVDALRTPRRREAGDAWDAMQLPCLVVYTASDVAGPNIAPDRDAGVVHRVTATLHVILGLPAPNDPGTKGKADGRLDARIERMRQDLLGWAPDGRFPAGRWAPLALRGGRLVFRADGRVWWEDTWETHRLMHGGPPPEPPGVVPSTVYSNLYEVDPSHGRGRLAGEADC